MTKPRLKSASLGALLLLAISAVTKADTLILKNGTQHEGTFVSGTETIIMFKENGILVRYSKNDIDSIQFGPEHSSETDENRPRNGSVRKGPVIPAGTEIAIRINGTIDSKNPGYDQTFSGQVAEAVRDGSGQIVLPRSSEAQLTIKQASGSGTAGAPDLIIDLEALTRNGQRYTVDSSHVVQDGAGVLTRGKDVHIPAKTVLRFKLDQPVLLVK